VKHVECSESLQTTTTATTLLSGAVGWDGSDILCKEEQMYLNKMKPYIFLRKHITVSFVQAINALNG
jgi:hypothetical protein